MVLRSNQRLKPSEIRFIQESINPNFQNGDDIHDAIIKIQDGELTPDDFPPIKVVRKDGKIYSFDNRRLYVFRVCEYRGYVSDIPVILMPIARLIDDRVTTENDGITVRVRRRTTEEHYMDRWLRERDDRGNRNLPANATKRKSSVQSVTVDGRLPQVSNGTNQTVKSTGENTYHRPAVYTISSSGKPSTRNPESVISSTRPPSNITPQTLFPDNRPYDTSQSDFNSESSSDVLSQFLTNDRRQTSSRRLQLAANYGADNYGFLPTEKPSDITIRSEPSNDRARSSDGLRKQPPISTHQPRNEVSRKTSRSSSRQSKANKRNVTKRSQVSTIIQPGVQTRPTPTDSGDSSQRKRSIFRRIVNLCCCCCVQNSH